jgi:acetyl-CoA C-acetyltransferase
MANRVAIVSIAQVNYKEKLNYAPEELAYEAIKPVLEETGLGFGPAYEKGGIDASLQCHEHSRIMRPFSASQLLEAVGANLRPDEKVDQDGALGVYEAVWQIASGNFETVLVVSECHDSVNRHAGNAIENLVFDPFYHRPLGLDNCNTAALQATRYMHQYGVTREQCAKVAVKNLKNAKSNPLALVSGDFTVEDILSSRVLAYPITKMETRPFADGACAMLLANEERAKKLTSKPVWIKGLANCCDGYFIGDRDLAESKALVVAVKKAYQMAGITDVRKEIDLAEVTDEFSYQELMEYEGLGFCEKGEGGKLIDSGVTRLGGALPVNSSGGALSGCAHTNIGMARVFEVVLQLRGEAGDRQVEGARTGLAHLAAGPCGQLQQVVILGTEP